MSIKPIRDFVAVVKDEAQKKTTSGLYMPDTVEDKIVTGKVIAVGSGHIRNEGTIPLELEIGDRVAFNRNSSIDLKVDETNYLLVREENIICKY